MIARILIIALLLSLNSCYTKETPISLRYILPKDSLKLIIINDNCGEWGGKEESIVVYRSVFAGPLFANYTQINKDCKTGKQTRDTNSKRGIRLNERNQQLIIECINELCENKLSRENRPSHSGLFCQVIVTDSSIIINDFPSANWNKFNQLRAQLEQQ